MKYQDKRLTYNTGQEVDQLWNFCSEFDVEIFEVVDDRLYWCKPSHISRHLSHRHEHCDRPALSSSSSHAQQALRPGQKDQVLPGHSEYSVLKHNIATLAISK